MSLMLRSALAGLGLTALATVALAAEPAAPVRLINQNDVIGISVKQSLIAMAKTGKGPFDIATAEGIERAYERHGNHPIWVDGNGYTSKALAVIDELKKASDWGLNDKDYSVPAVQGSNLTTVNLAEAELALTRVAVKYARDAHSGRFDPLRISEMIERGSTLPDPVAVLTGLTTTDDPATFLKDFNPKHAEFERLRQKYLALRGGRVDPDQVRVPDGPRLKPGDSSNDIVLIRQRMRVASNGDPKVYDEALAAAVRDVQQTRGYRADGVITSTFRRLLNQQLKAAPPRTAQMEKLMANMERWRWLPEDLGKTHIFNNVPEFTTRVVRDGEIIHETRIVVGKTETATPIFSNKMRYLEFNPYWRVPDSIKVNELLPAIARRGSGALAGRGLKMAINGREINASTVNFGSTDIRNYEIYMPPGPGNALGDVKFMFPNRFAVYMHDTPSKDLFGANSRAFSHGCVRVQNPHRFAEVIMGEGSGWSIDRTKSQFADKENMQIQLDKPIDVHMTYFTIRIDAQGQMRTIDDVYSHDRRTIHAMAGRWGSVDVQREPKAEGPGEAMANIRGGGNDNVIKVFSGGSGTFASIFNGNDGPKKKRKRARSEDRAERVKVRKPKSSGDGGTFLSGGFFGGFTSVAKSKPVFRIRKARPSRAVEDPWANNPGHLVLKH